MEKLVIIRSALHKSDIEWIESATRSLDCICSCYGTDLKEKYTIKSYLEEKYIHSGTTHAVMDRNLMSSLTRAAKNGIITTKDERDAITLLAFLRASEIEIEPGIGLAEYTDTYCNPTPSAELQLLRKIDNIPSDNLLALSKGETDLIDINKSSYKGDLVIRNGPKSGHDIHQWEMHYGYALMAFIFHHQNLTPLQYAKKYIHWMWQDFAIGSLSIPFIAVFLSQKFGGVIKGINSLDEKKAIKGIKNAAWDMTIVHYWTNFVIHRKRNGPLLILCTQDKALRFIAEHVAFSGESMTVEILFNELFKGTLKTHEIEELLQFYNDLDRKKSEPHRQVHSYRSNQKHFDSYIADLETSVINNIKGRATLTS